MTYIVKLIKEIAIKKHKEWLYEMAASIMDKSNDEHDLVHVVNSIPRDHLSEIKSPEHFHDYVDTHVKTKGHAFHGQNSDSLKAYGHGVHALLEHRPHPKATSVRENLQDGGSVEVYGASKKDNKLSQKWKDSGGGKDTTPKTDIIVRNKHGKTHSTISLKQGERSQLMSGESGNVRGVYGVAASRYTNDEKKKKDIHNTIEKVAKIQEKSSSVTDEKERDKLVEQGSKHLADLHARHPGLSHHVSHVAATGEGIFEDGSDAIAKHVLSYKLHSKGKKGAAKISDPSKKGELETSVRFAKGKGTRYAKNQNGERMAVGKRQHALRIDSFFRSKTKN
jgi:hypothetical protein